MVLSIGGGEKIVSRLDGKSRLRSDAVLPLYYTLRLRMLYAWFRLLEGVRKSAENRLRLCMVLSVGGGDKKQLKLVFVLL